MDAAVINRLDRISNAAEQLQDVAYHLRQAAEALKDKGAAYYNSLSFDAGDLEAMADEVKRDANNLLDGVAEYYESEVARGAY